jgi:hypothetical protein
MCGKASPFRPDVEWSFDNAFSDPGVLMGLAFIPVIIVACALVKRAD